MGKGVSLFISHVLAIAILFVALGVVAAGMYNYYAAVSEQSQRAQSLAIAQSIAESAVVLEKTFRDSPRTLESGETNATLGEVVLSVPPRIGGGSYSVELRPHGDFWINATATQLEATVNDVSAETQWAAVVIRTTGPVAIVTTYPIYNLVTPVNGTARVADRIRIAYLRDTSGDRILLERA